MKYRIEKDSLGDVKVPADALWGAQTQRALENFKISGIKFTFPFGRSFIEALGVIKYSAASSNQTLKLLSAKKANAIKNASKAVIKGDYDDSFPLDVFQTGSGTSTNMNANEVIANVASTKSKTAIGANENNNTVMVPHTPGGMKDFQQQIIEGTFVGKELAKHQKKSNNKKQWE